MSADRFGKPADLEHQAAAWVARQDRGLTAGEQDEFFQWLAADPRHGEHLAQQRETARKLKSLAQWRPEHGVRPNPDLLEPPRRVRAWLGPLLAVAACAAIATGLWWLRAPQRESSAVAIAALPPPTVQRLLEDGSTIDLNRGAHVEVQFTAEERRVTLVQGEALFTVTKNPQRPFIVQAGRVAIRAVGTAFNVNLQPAAVEVLVTEGSVAVDQPAAVPAPDPSASAAGETPAASASAARPVATIATVAAGHRALVPLAETAAAPEVVQVTREQMARLLAWQPRQLEFADTPLAHVVAEFNRENRVKMVIDDPALAALPIGASLRSDNVEGFVRLLEASFHVRVERRGEVIVLRREK